jgi:serine/threonine protein kinase
MKYNVELLTAGFSGIEPIEPMLGMKWRALYGSQRVLLDVVAESRRGDALRVSERFSLLQTIHSAHITRVLRLISISSSAVVVCEDPGGRPLEGGGPLPTQLACLQQMARAVHHLHGLSLTHGQLRPSAWKLVDDAAVLVDLAAVFAPDDVSPRQARGFYQAPELHSSGRTEAADVYALGVIAFELLCGRLPFSSADPLKLQHEHESLAPEPAATLPAPLAHLLRQMLSKDPERRPPLTLVISALSPDLEGITELKGIRSSLSRQQLIGREAEQAILQDALEVAAGG